MCEKGDLAGATSSASSKMIHGGLRYLEHGAFRLVRESLAEREVLLGITPHLVRPMRFVLPHGPGLRPRWMLRAGLFFYDRLGGARSMPASSSVDLRDGPLGTPLRDGVRDGFVYSDCVVDDARLTIVDPTPATRRDTAPKSLTRTAFVSASRDGGVWRAVLRAGDGSQRARGRRRASSSTSPVRGCRRCCAAPGSPAKADCGSTRAAISSSRGSTRTTMPICCKTT